MSSIHVERLDALRAALLTLREEMLAMESELAPQIDAIPPEERPSARNLAHYLALRQEDVQDLQTALSALGLSSLGRSESHVMATINAVLAAVHRLSEQPATPPDFASPPVDTESGPERLREHTAGLLGPQPSGRATRIMVTLPSEAASDAELVDRLVAAGMDLARINCAHDDAESWRAMTEHVRTAGEKHERPVRIVTDLGGPKIRTGEIEPGPRVLRWRPERDARGMLVASARIWITFSESREAPPEGMAVLPLARSVVEQMRPGDELRVRDLRGRKREVRIVDRQGEAVVGECERGVWIEEGNKVELRRHGEVKARGKVKGVPPTEEPIRLRPGDRLILTGGGVRGRAALRDGKGGVTEPARIACSLPSALETVEVGHRVMFDDGKISAQVVDSTDEGLQLVIDRGGTLRENKGINLPDSVLHLRGLTDKDLSDLDAVAPWTDIVGMSFVQSVEDVLDLQAALEQRGASECGVLLKIETRLGFERLPRLLLAGLQSPPIGVMVARGDLAVELGYERLAEVQEEILWLCEAAHVPVVWATQVLETLAKKGQPSRAEVTDAAMSGRAESVMLNKGPFVAQAVEFLDDVLQRMESHQEKKTARLRSLSVSRLV